MARKPIAMRHIQNILRLKYQNRLSLREIARSCGLPASTVGDYLQRAQAAGLGWPLPESLADPELMNRLRLGTDWLAASAATKRLPDWPAIHRELRRPNVTLQLLWREYRQAHPEGYQRSQFCQLYRDWAKTIEPVLRQVHEPGQKLFVDWAGQTVPVHQADGAVGEASLFVAVLGASKKIFAAAFPNQQLESWIAGHCQAFSYYGGVVRAVVPDNTKTAVVHPDRYEPVLHRTYQEMAQHYGTVILPARIKKPRDKAPVETAVGISQRQILAALRDRRFFSVGELNQTIRPLLDQLNAQPFQKLEGSRNSWFEAFKKDKLLPLPATAFELATWSQAKVNIDYHVAVDHHFYSVPYSLVHCRLDVRLSERTVELFQEGKRVAVHARSHQRGKFTTLEEHRPKAHQRYLEWTPGRILHQGCKMILGGTSKSNKSWCLLDLALSVASGQPWWGRQCAKLPVVYINFELHTWAVAQRINALCGARPECKAMGKTLHIWNLRGHNADITLLRPKLEEQLAKHQFGLIILDPAYKVLGNRDENANGEIASLMNEFEAMAQKTGAAIVVAHHFAKGDSTAKSAMDRMSGAGAWSRDPDTIVVLTPHEEPDHFTVTSILRNLPQLPEFVVGWDYPLMKVASDLNPEALRRPQSKNKVCSDKEFIEAIITDEGKSFTKIMQEAKDQLEVSRSTANRLLKRLVAAGLVINSGGLYWRSVTSVTSPKE